MQRIVALIALTVRELVRRRVFYVLLLFGMGLVFLSLPLVQLSVGQWGRIITDVGLGSANLVIDLLAAVLGATVLAADIERRSIYLLLATPVPRQTIVVGRFLGLVAVLWFSLACMAGGMELMLLLARSPPGLGVYQAWFGLGLEAASVAALAMVFSSFASSLASGIFAVSFLAIGHLTWNLDFFANRSDAGFTRWIGHGIALLIPNLEQFDFKSAASDGRVMSAGAMRLTTLSALLYCVFFVWLAGRIFSRRDLK